MKNFIEFLFTDKHRMRPMSFAELGFVAIGWTVVSILAWAAITSIL